MRDDLLGYLKEKGTDFIETESMELGDADVVYWTRVQKERFADEAVFKKAAQNFRIDADVMKQLKKDAILMHPLPRIDEIAPEVDADSRAKYFKQAGNGMFVRMALLDRLLQTKKP